MSIKTAEKKERNVFLLPVLMAAPILAGAAIGFVLFGPRIHKLVNILIKLVVKA